MDINEINGFFASLTLEKLVPAIIILVVDLFLIKILTKLFDRLLGRSKVSKSIHGFLRSAFRILLYSITGLMVADTLGFDVSSLVALLSIISLGISLALQNSLANVAGGIMVLTNQPFHVGDWVEVGGVSGTVLEIGMSYTKLQTADKKEIYVPNSEISGTKIVNYTAAGQRRVDLTFTASYDAPTDVVKAALLEAAMQPAVLAEPAPFAGVESYGDSAVKYVLRVWVATADYWDVYYAINESVRVCYDEAGITMTYPHLNVHLDAAPS